MEAPKLFVSYSWTSPDHEERVVQLATELRESGVDVILDKWDLREGHDAYAFMEKMVTDPAIKKVALVCDRAYAEKANSRTGGVGVEAQIVSAEIYEKQAQDKFVALVVERDDEGRAHVPAYYTSRIHIDLSEPGSYSENFDRLLRWVFDKPVYEKPILGKPPAFLEEARTTALISTSSRYRRTLDAIRGNKDYAVPSTVEYFRTLADQFETLRLDPTADPFDEEVVRSIETFRPYRNEAIGIFHAIGLFMDTPEMRVAVHRFFEQLIPYLHRPENVSSWRESDFDNYRFLVHELFLYAVACLIRHERFVAAAYLLSTDYYIQERADYGRGSMVPFQIIRQYTPSLEARNQRMKLNRVSVRADLLKERCAGVGVNFQHLMQADFVLFMRDAIAAEIKEGGWWPETLLYVGRVSSAFEVFARSASAAYFERAKVILGVESKAQLQEKLAEFASRSLRLPRWDFHSIDPNALLGFESIGTKA